MSKFTPWFKDGQKPARPGVYQQRSGGWGRDIGYQKWDGKQWYCWRTSPYGAENSFSIASKSHQNDPWRGLARKPKGQS